MRTAKRIISFALSFLMVVTAIDFSGFTVNAAESDDYAYESSVSAGDEVPGEITNPEIGDTDETSVSNETEIPEGEEPQASPEALSQVTLDGKTYTVSGTLTPGDTATVKYAEGDKVYALEGIEVDTGYTFNGYGTLASGNQITYSSFVGMIKIYTYDEATPSSVLSTGSYAFKASTGKKYLVKLSPNSSSGSTMTYDFFEVPHIKEVTFPFDKLVVYKGILYDRNTTYSCDYIRFMEDKVKKMPGSVELVDGSTMSYTTYNDFGIMQKQYRTYTYNESTGQYDIGTYVYYDSNILKQPVGNYIIVYQSVYTSYTGLKFDYTMPLEIRDITEMPLVYTKDAEGNIVKNSIPWEDFLGKGDYTYFSADLEASKKYKFENIYSGAQFSMYDASGNFVTNGSTTYNQTNSGTEFSVPKSGRYYFAGRKNTTSEANVSIIEVGTSTPTAPSTLKVGDKLRVSQYSNTSTEATYKGTIKPGDRIDMSGKTPELYELSGFTNGLGYQICCYDDANNVTYQSTAMMTGTFQVKDGSMAYSSTNNYYHVYPTASDKYYVLLQEGSYGRNTFEIVSNKKPKSMESDIKVCIYEGMYLYDDTYQPLRVFNSMAYKNPVKFIFADGSEDSPKYMEKYGSLAAQVVDESGATVTGTQLDNIPAGKYTLKFTSPAALSIPYEVKPRSEMPLVFYEENGENVSVPVYFENWSANDKYSYFAANLKADKYYRFAIDWDSVEYSGCAFFTLRGQNGNVISDNLGKMTRRNAEVMFKVPTDGTYYFVAYDWKNEAAIASLEELDPDKIAKIELATEYDYQKEHYQTFNFTVNYEKIYEVMQPTFKVTYETGEVTYTTFNDNFGMIQAGKVYKADKTTEASKEINKNEIGDYYASFGAVGYEKEFLVPFSIRDISEVTEELKSGESKNVKGFVTPEKERSMKTYVYKVHLKAGVKTAFASTNGNVGFMLKDANTKKLLAWTDSEDSITYKADADTDAYLVVAVWKNVEDEIRSREMIEVTDVKILSQPYKTTYYAGLDSYLSAGLVLEIAYSDGVKEKIYSPSGSVDLHNGEKLVVKTPVAALKKYTDKEGRQCTRLLPGSFKQEIQVGSYNKTIYTSVYTVKNVDAKTLSFGTAVAIPASTGIKECMVIGEGNKVFTTDLGTVYKADLVAGTSYEIEANFYGSMAIYDDTFTMEYPAKDFCEPYDVKGMSFVPKYTGTYYIRVASKTATTLCLTKAETVASAEIIKQPLGSENPYQIGMEPIRPLGVCIRITYADGSTEELVYGDDLWEKYVREIIYYYNGDLTGEGEKDHSKEGTYKCKFILLSDDGDKIELVTDSFTLSRSELMENISTIEDGDGFAGGTEYGAAYLKLTTQAGLTYRILGERIKTAFVLYAVKDGEYSPVKKVIPTDRDFVSEITFTAEDNVIYVLCIEDAYDSSFYLEMAKVSTVSEFTMAADSVSSLSSEYGKNLTLDGLKFSITYAGDGDAISVVYQDESWHVLETGEFYSPGFSTDLYQADKATPVKKDANGFYPANKAGENYYLSVALNEPTVDAGVKKNYFIPYTITGATADYKIIYNNGLARVQMVKPGAVISGTMADQVVAKDTPTALSKNQFVFPGYSLVGFSTMETMSGIHAEWTEASSLKEVYPNEFFYPEEKVVNLSLNGESVTLYAVWKKEIYSINYHMAGAKFAVGYDSNRALSVDGAEVTLPIVLNGSGEVDGNVIDLTSIKGYTFGGWYEDDAYKKPIEKIAGGSTKNVDVYAKWVPLSYHITFYGNGGTASVNEYTQDLYFDRSVALKANAYKKDAKALLGWSIDEEVLSTTIDHNNYESYVTFEDKGSIWITKENVNTLDPDGDRNIKLYAIWGDWFTISYDLDGDGILGDTYEDYAAVGAITMADGMHPDHYTYGSTAKLDAKPIRKGYTFGGWYLDSAYKKKFTSIGKTTAGNLKLYAKWTQNNYNIAFNANGGTGKMAVIKTNYFDTLERAENCEEITIPNCEFTKKGYAFSHWMAKVNGVDQIFMPGQKVSNLIDAKGKTVTLAAQWVPGAYDVYYHTRGGKLTDSYEDVLEENATYRTSYVFNPKASPIALATPTISGYTFGGWFADETYKKQIKDLKGVAGDTHLYAKWIADYTVVFDANGGVGEMPAVTGNTGKAISLANKFKKDGYAFMGWSVDGETVLYADKFALMSPDTKYLTGVEGSYKLTLKAVWKKDFTLTFMPSCHGATGLNMVGGQELTGYTYGSEITILPIPSRNGYAFNGWYSDAACKKKVLKIAKTDFGNKVLYAGWKPLNYNINFDANAPIGTKVTGKTAKQKMTYDVAKKLNKCGYKLPGYTFKGWALSPNGAVKYTDAAEVAKFSGNFRSEVTLYAVWEKDVYTISYNFGDGEIVEVTGADAANVFYKKDMMGRNFRVRYEIGDSLTFAQIPELGRIGYTFAGWYEDAACKKKFTGIKAGGMGSYTLYAKWTVNK